MNNFPCSAMTIYVLCGILATTALVALSLYFPSLTSIKYNGKSGRNFVAQKYSRDDFYPETNWTYEKIGAGKRCSASQANRNVEKRGGANCPDQRLFMNKIATEFSEWRNGQSPITLVMIGCNKGDSVVESMRMFSHNSEISTVKWYNKLVAEIGESEAIGTCRRKYETDSEIPQGMEPRPVRAYCMEPGKSTYETINRICKDLGYSKFGLSVIYGACAERKTVLSFPVVQPGIEWFGLARERTDHAGYNLVNVTTIDNLVQEEKLSVIDYLSVDTEGHDFPVLLGAVMTLATKTVRIVEFEYHRVARWKTARLEELLDYMDNLGFDCYWESNQGILLRITGCYTEQMTVPEFADCSNVICVNRREKPLARFMESLASEAGFGADLE
mmetsp:Transcript_15545/g.27322  ORF Transcript_15545/g.27322 Transcript_15545/m.27322 type:complete len:387 (-) Transcript_15545:342-1502(-)|eukprot:CAMPEP_0184694236 /NCGR_PEP_ID=MMETSP0313-20130426/2263_1 /TAXON_ID=2792 /ORGANISM="Porphyridium aerugineum, Strain SAG 1380-2" /LENGTH=386 /DNA_ID=CAMNT_0027152497 /DNA_START=254 /DNA_END=1414 /DNA_ORIENTATION=-